MGFIILNTIDKLQNRISYHFFVSEDAKKYFSGREFWIEYDVSIESVPNSIAVIPFVTSILPMMWLTDTTVVIPELDRDFYRCILKIKEGFIDMYPGVEFRGNLQVQRIEENKKNVKIHYQSACLYSGGVDATTSVFRHIDEKPLLISLWGSDVRSDNVGEWELVNNTLSKSAKNYSLDLSCVHTTFRDFDNENALDYEFHEILGKGWWYGIKHGIGIIGHVAPLAWKYGIAKIYMASSNCPEDGTKVKCASDPRIDNQVRFCGCQVYHDGFELNRQKKVHYIVEYAKSHPELKIPLHVCWESHTGGNCCHCEKCYRTMAELWIEGEDPREYGFDYPDSVFQDMYKYIALKCNDMAKNTWTYGKERLIDNWTNIKKTDYGKKIAWIKRFDFHDLEKNWDRKAYRAYRKIKTLFLKFRRTKQVTVKSEPTIDMWPIEKRVVGAMNLYEQHCGYRFDINNPRTFTEKIIWYKIYYDNPELVKIVDKFSFKKYIRNKLGDGYTLPLYGAYSSINALKTEWAKLPTEFMLKSNVQSDGFFIKHIADKNAVDLESLMDELCGWLDVKQTLINSFCRAYYGATPLILVEKYAENIAGQLYDYKLFCFDGEPRYVYAAADHFCGEDYPISFYDFDWNKLNVKYGNHKSCDIPAPHHLSMMVEIAKKLSYGFPFVRVDFFDTPEKLYVAEMTFYPGGGQTLYYPSSFNEEMGELFVLPIQTSTNE